MEKLMAVTDLVMLDMKHIEEEEHIDLTGCSNHNVLAFARYLAIKRVPVWVRHVVVPGITDDPEQLTRLGEFIALLPNVKALDVLPYHVMGVSKYKELGIPYPLEGVEAATRDQAKEAKQIILTAFREARQKLKESK